MGTTGPGKKWWQQLNGRWFRTLEEALASDDEDRVSLAWAIVRHVGTDWGAIAEAADRAGLARQTLHNAVSGANGVSKKTKRAFVKAFSMRMADFHGEHPLSVGRGGDRAEPGDENWEMLWVATRKDSADKRSAEQVKRDEPMLFPEDVTTDVTEPVTPR